MVSFAKKNGQPFDKLGSGKPTHRYSSAILCTVVRVNHALPAAPRERVEHRDPLKTLGSLSPVDSKHIISSFHQEDRDHAAIIMNIVPARRRTSAAGGPDRGRHAGGQHYPDAVPYRGGVWRHQCSCRRASVSERP